MSSHKEKHVERQIAKLTSVALLAMLAFIICVMLAMLSTIARVPLAIEVFGYASLVSFVVFVATGCWAVLNTFRMGE